MSTNTPTTEHRLTTADGRTLAVRVSGPVDGPTVLFVHSAPGSRAFDPDPATTATAGIRLVTFDRAGYGDSTPLPLDAIPTIAGHAADAALVAESLEAGPLDLVGWSAGGRVAAALAAARPELARSLAIVGTPAPQDEVPWVPEEFHALTAAMQADPGTALATLTGALTQQGMVDAIATNDDVAVAQVTADPGDATLLAARPDLRAAVIEMVRVGTGGGVAGMAADIVADQVVDWGFDPTTITAPTTCWYGTDDDRVPPTHGAWWASKIPGAELHEVEAIGHLVISRSWDQILAARP